MPDNYFVNELKSTILLQDHVFAVLLLPTVGFPAELAITQPFLASPLGNPPTETASSDSCRSLAGHELTPNAEYKVTNHNTDQGLLTEVMEKSKEMLDAEVIEAVVDMGYESREDIRKCIEARVPPACYEGTAIQLELQKQSEFSCFTRNDDDAVICPMGNILTRVRTRGLNSIYSNRDASLTWNEEAIFRSATIDARLT